MWLAADDVTVFNGAGALIRLMRNGRTEIYVIEFGTPLSGGHPARTEP